MGNIVNNQRIAKNTIYLYLRMLISMAVTLYTSRVIIQTLGIDDFGIYNIVGGIVVLFGFVSNSLRSSSQRFLSFELGKDDYDSVNRVMNMSIQCHVLMASVLLFLAETVGLWFVVNKLNIPADRYDVSVVVYQLSVVTFIVNMFQAPFQAAIISYEKMSFYAIVSIFDVLMKLGIAYLLTISPFDKLIVYSILLLVVSIISLFFPACYTYFKIKIGRYWFVRDKALFKQMFSFAGWSMFTGCTFIGNQQGGNILLNIYSGVAANGAFGIANQVTSAVYSFVTNFQSAFEPQIVKTYSSGQHKEMYALMNRASAFSYYLFLLLAVPFISQTSYVLSLWLGACPDYAAGFCQLMLVYFIVDAIEAPLWMLIGATGNNKVYSIYSGIISLLNLPIAGILLVNGYSVYWVFAIRVLLNILLGIIRPFYVKYLVPTFSLREYIGDALIRAGLVTFILCIYLFFNNCYFSGMYPLISITLSIAVTLTVVWFIGMNKNDQIAILNIIRNKINQ